MNLNRLSSNPAKLSPIQLEKLRENICKLLSEPSNLEIKADGRIFIKSLNKYYTGSGNIKADLLDKNGLVHHSFDSISECAKFLGLSAGTVAQRLRDNQPIKVGSKNCLYIKRDRVEVLLSKSAGQKLGPKFIYIKSTSFRKTPQILGLVFRIRVGFPSRSNAWCKYRLPTITRQFHNKAKLAFIYPNFDGAKRIGPHNRDILSVLVGLLLGGCCAKREKSGGVRF